MNILNKAYCPTQVPAVSDLDSATRTNNFRANVKKVYAAMSKIEHDFFGPGKKKCTAADQVHQIPENFTVRVIEE